MDKFSLIIVIGVIALTAYYFMSNKNNGKTAVENTRLGAEYLATNKVKEGVVETASGLQYQVLTQGSGTQHPSAKATVKVHYHGTLMDGKVFDSSVDRGEPISFLITHKAPPYFDNYTIIIL